MNDHLSDEQLIGYVHYTLSDAERETMDAHLKRCPDCRARMVEYEGIQRRIRYDLVADIRTVSPPSSMRFAAIAPRLERRAWREGMWGVPGQFLPGATALAALAGMAVALISLFQSAGFRVSSSTVLASQSALPFVACGCFAVAVMGNYKGDTIFQPRLILARVLAFVLWIGTAIVGLQAFAVVVDVVMWLLFTRISPRAAPMGLWTLIPLGILWIAMVVGGGEYHYRNVGQPKSWRLFGWTIAIELLILVLPFLLGG